MYILECYLKLERISDCLCGEGRGGELDPTLALSLLWRLPMSQMTQKGCSCLKHPGVRPALVAGGRHSDPPTTLLNVFTPTTHTCPPCRFSQAALSPWPMGTGAGRSTHSQWEWAEEHTGAPSTILAPAHDLLSAKTTAGLHRKGPRSTCFSWIESCFP